MKSIRLNQRQYPCFLQFLVQEKSSLLCPSSVKLYLHLAVLFHEVGRETLHVPLVQVRDVENPLSAHLVLNVQLEEQLVHPYRTHAIVLGNLCDGDGLRAT